MDELLLLLLSGGASLAGLVAIWVFISRSLAGHRRLVAERDQRWAEAARALELTLEEGPRLTGEGVEVHEEVVLEATWTVVEITGLPPAFHAARSGKVHRTEPISVDSVLDDLERLLPDLLGETHIGEEIEYRGDPAVTLAYLDPDGRLLLESLLARFPDTDLQDGRLHLTWRQQATSVQELEEVVRLAREVAEHFAGPGVEARLFAGTQQGTELRRLSCLQALLDGGFATSGAAVDSAAASGVPVLELEAAAARGRMDEVRTLHAEGLRTSRSIGVCTQQDEAFLLSLLDGPWGERAAQRLAEVGTVQSVERLHGLSQGKTVLAGPASRAVAAIHERLGPVEAGGLALSEADLSGALSEVRGGRQRVTETS